MRTADAASGQGERATPPGMWWTRRAVGLHVTIVVVVPTFLALFWWQVQRVRQGNTLSWAYVFEWPFFTGYAVYLWWKLVHDQPDLAQTTLSPAAPNAVPAAPEAAPAAPEAAPAAPEALAPAADPDDETLAAYNRYLAQLNASGRRKAW